MTSPPESLDIALDRSLQVWVLFPITLATLLMGLLRRNLSLLIYREPPTSVPKIREGNVLKRSRILRQNANLIMRSQFEARRFFLTRGDGKGALYRKPKEHASMTALMNPESLADQVMNLCLSIVPHMILGTWARYMFAGLAVCKLPFSLTPVFRPMLQSGMELAGRNLPVSYVSSLSWYVLNLFGNSGLLSIIGSDGGLHDEVFIPTVASQISMTVAPDKVFNQERETMEKFVHECCLSDNECALLRMTPSQFAQF